MDSKNSLAYEYGRFEEKEQSVPAIKTIKKSKSHKGRAGVGRATVYMTVIVLTLSALIYTRAVQAEVSSEYNNTMAELNQIKSENAILQVKLGQELSADNIEKIAREQLNMQELDSSKIEYVNFNSEGRAEVLKEPKWYDDIVAFFDNLFI